MPLTLLPDDVVIRQVLIFLQPVELVGWSGTTKAWYRKLVTARPLPSIWQHVAQQAEWAPLPLDPADDRRETGTRNSECPRTGRASWWNSIHTPGLRSTVQVIKERRSHPPLKTATPNYLDKLDDQRLTLYEEIMNRPKPEPHEGLEAWQQKFQVPWIKSWYDLCRWHRLVQRSIYGKVRVDMRPIVQQVKDMYSSFQLLLLHSSNEHHKVTPGWCSGTFLRRSPHIYIPDLDMKLEYPCAPEQLRTLIDSGLVSLKKNGGGHCWELDSRDFHITSVEWNHLLSSSSASLPLSQCRDHRDHLHLLRPLKIAKEVLVDDLATNLESLAGGSTLCPDQVIATPASLLIHEPGDYSADDFLGTAIPSIRMPRDNKATFGSLIFELPVVGTRGELIVKCPDGLQEDHFPIVDCCGPEQWPPPSPPSPRSPLLRSPKASRPPLASHSCDDGEATGNLVKDKDNIDETKRRTFNLWNVEKQKVDEDEVIEYQRIPPPPPPLPPCRWTAFSNNKRFTESTMMMPTKSPLNATDHDTRQSNANTVVLRVESGYCVTLVYKLHKVPVPPPPPPPSSNQLLYIFGATQQPRYIVNRTKKMSRKDALDSPRNPRAAPMSGPTGHSQLIKGHNLVLCAVHRALEAGMTLGWIMSHRYDPEATTTASLPLEHLLQGADAAWYKWFHDHFVIPLKARIQGSSGYSGYSRYSGVNGQDTSSTSSSSNRSSGAVSGDGVEVVFEHIRIRRNKSDEHPEDCSIQHYLNSSFPHSHFESTMKSRHPYYDAEDDVDDGYDDGFPKRINIRIQWMNLGVLCSGGDDDATTLSSEDVQSSTMMMMNNTSCCGGSDSCHDFAARRSGPTQPMDLLSLRSAVFLTKASSRFKNAMVQLHNLPRYC